MHNLDMQISHSFEFIDPIVTECCVFDAHLLLRLNRFEEKMENCVVALFFSSLFFDMR